MRALVIRFEMFVLRGDLAAVEPAKHGVELLDHELNGEQADAGGGRLTLGSQPGTLAQAGGTLAANGMLGWEVEHAKDVEAAEKLDPNAANCAGGHGIFEPGHEPGPACFGQMVLSAGRGVFYDDLAAHDFLLALEPFEHGVKLAGAHIPYAAKLRVTMKAVQQIVAVAGLHSQEPEDRFVGGGNAHHPYSIME